jgi:hypothetical protein
MTGGATADDSIRRADPTEGQAHAGLACVKRSEPSYRSIAKVRAHDRVSYRLAARNNSTCGCRDIARYEATSIRVEPNRATDACLKFRLPSVELNTYSVYDGSTVLPHIDKLLKNIMNLKIGMIGS